MKNYQLSSNRSGYCGRGAPTAPPPRSATNERDLGLALRASERLHKRTIAAMLEGGDTRGSVEMREIARSIAQYLRTNKRGGASAKQLAFLCKVLGEPVPSPIDPIPAACRVLPLKPPGR